MKSLEDAETNYENLSKLIDHLSNIEIIEPNSIETKMIKKEELLQKNYNIENQIINLNTDMISKTKEELAMISINELENIHDKINRDIMRSQLEQDLQVIFA